MISTSKLPPADWCGADSLWLGWSSINRELYDLRLHDEVSVVKWVWVKQSEEPLLGPDGSISALQLRQNEEKLNTI